LSTNNSALNQIPQSFNFLSPLNFKFMIKRAPNLNFDIYKMNLPGISTTPVNQPTPFINIPWTGDHLQFSPLYVQFKVDENFNNYMEVHNWLRDITKADNFKEYKDLAKNPYYTGSGVESEIIVSILDSAKNPNVNFDFHGAFPVALSELVFDAQLKDVEYITATATFAYMNYDITPLNVSV
jgi:hypothetical protein